MQGPSESRVTGSSTFKLLSFTDTQTFEPEKHGQAASGFLGYALACLAVRRDGHRRWGGTVTVHWQVRRGGPVGGHHDAACCLRVGPCPGSEAQIIPNNPFFE